MFASIIKPLWFFKMVSLFFSFFFIVFQYATWRPKCQIWVTVDQTAKLVECISLYSILRISTEGRRESDKEVGSLSPAVHTFILLNGTKYSRVDQEKFVEDSRLYSFMSKHFLPSKHVFYKFYLVHSWIPCPKYDGVKYDVTYVPVITCLGGRFRINFQNSSGWFIPKIARTKYEVTG